MMDKQLKDRFKQEDRRDLVPAALMSGAVHAILFLGLFSVFQWSTTTEIVYAELWAPEAVSAGNDPNGVAEKLPVTDDPNEANLDGEDPTEEDFKNPVKNAAEEERLAEEAAAQAEAQRIEAEKIAAEARQAEEARRAEEARLAQEKAEAERLEKVRQDAIEAERRAEEERAQKEAERIAQEKLDRERKIAEKEREAVEARRLAEEKAAEEKRLAEAEKKAQARRIAEEKRVAEAKAEAERQERRRIRKVMREQELARLNAKVDPNGTRSGTPHGDKRNYRQNLSGSALASYNDKVVSCVRQNISIDVPPSTKRNQFTTEYIVKLLPNGEIQGMPLKKKASGWDAYDRAVDIAIRRCNPFPKPERGYQPPRELHLIFDPVDDRR